jgi:hypothetical protein
MPQQKKRVQPEKSSAKRRRIEPELVEKESARIRKSTSARLSSKKVDKLPFRKVDKLSQLEPDEKIVGVMAKNLSTQDVCKMLFDTSKPTPTDDSELKKKGDEVRCNSTIDPYSDSPRGDEVIDLSNTIVTERIEFVKYRFDENYIFCIERVELEPNEYKIANYVAWSIKRCRYGEDDEAMVPDSKGVLKKRFAFSGRIASLPELHEAVMNLCSTSQTESMISWDKAQTLEQDKFGCVDISTACRPVYSTKVYAFGGHRAYMDDVTYTNGTQHAITYKALVLTKWRNDTARSRSKSKEKYFVLHVPARRMHHLLLAIEMAMVQNNIKPKSSFYFAQNAHEEEDDEDYTPSGEESDDESEPQTPVQDKKRKRRESDANSDDETQERRRKIRKAAIAPAYVDISDTEDEDNDDAAPASNPEMEDDDEEEEDDPTPTVQEEEAEADDKPTASDQEFIDDQSTTDQESLPAKSKKGRKRKRSPPPDSDTEPEPEKKKKKPQMTDAMLAKMYRRMMTSKKKTAKN